MLPKQLFNGFDNSFRLAVRLWSVRLGMLLRDTMQLALMFELTLKLFAIVTLHTLNLKG